MAKNKNHKKNKRNGDKRERHKKILLPEETKKWIWGVAMILVATIITLSFFNKSGPAGKKIFEGLTNLIGNTTFAVPLLFLVGGLVFFSTKYKRFFYALLLAIAVFICGLSGLLETLEPTQSRGGFLGYIEATPLFNLFGPWVTQLIFVALIFVACLIFWQLLRQPVSQKTKTAEERKETMSVPQLSLIRKIFAPKFKVKEIEPKVKPLEISSSLALKLEKAKIGALPVVRKSGINYRFPPLDLLELDRGGPLAGDTRINATIIKKTLQNFDIPVEMSEVNIGPTVTQYTLKPSEGVKLSKITALSNDLALALASHPIRIEAPIPGKSLVGIEVPNKIRAQVRLRNLIEDSAFQKSTSHLNIVLGRDVSGLPFYADLARMPHILVAGSTGAGKTIFLNNLILSLLYKNSPEIMRFILIDPKRVEFPVYNELPHLLSPVIFDASRTVNALRWLIGEMERRFDVLSLAKKRDVGSYNAEAQNGAVLPYIVLIIDELADLMAAKGREVEAGVVRLAQMSRAVGIHLVVATQRPSVEVITGLIKANITSRVTFQVASQVDSRTVLDMAGAEKLLGLGDLLYLSSELGKPRRLQSAYVSEKEVKKVVGFIKTENARIKEQLEANGQPLVNHLAQGLEKSLEMSQDSFEGSGSWFGQDDPFYEEAKRIVLEARKASASLLQRRLRIGYARAARLIDILEERGVVGPGEGARPREVFLARAGRTIEEIEESPAEEDDQIEEEETEEEAAKETETEGKDNV